MTGSNRAHKVAPVAATLVSVYPHLRRIAKRLLRGERPSHTLQPTALANEAVSRLLRREAEGLQDRELLAFGVREMQTILVDSGRRYRTRLCYLDAATPAFDPGKIADLVHLKRCLERLGRRDQRAREVVELRFFVGLSIPEVAQCLGVSARSVNADWEFARCWLAKHWVDRDLAAD